MSGLTTVRELEANAATTVGARLTEQAECEHLPITETGKLQKISLKESWRSQRTFDLEAGVFLD